MNPIVPLRQFVDQIASAKAPTSKAASPTISGAGRWAPPADPQLEHSAITDYLLSHYLNVEVSNSFADAAGHAVDCIRINQQPGLRGAKQAPDAPPEEVLETLYSRRGGPRARAAAAPVAEGRKDPLGNDAVCPPGFVPMLRVTPERIRRVGGLGNLFQKAPGGGRHPSLGSGTPTPRTGTAGGPALPAQNVGGALHGYAHASQFVNDSPCTGARSWLNLWTPNPAPGVFALSQQWVAGGSGPGLQTIEGGWHVYPDFYNDPVPITRLFIFWTADGYQSTGNYNLLTQPGQPGFVQTDNTWVLGGAFQKDSVAGGDQPGFMMQWLRDPANGNWWLTLQGTDNAVAVGYFPAAIYMGGMLSQAAQNVDFGGETCSQTGSNIAGPMGSGQPASAGWQHAAFHKEIAFFSSGGWMPATLSPQQQDAPAYTLDLHNNSSSAWSTYFFFGGPGGGLH